MDLVSTLARAFTSIRIGRDQVRNRNEVTSLHAHYIVEFMFGQIQQSDFRATDKDRMKKMKNREKQQRSSVSNSHHRPQRQNNISLFLFNGLLNFTLINMKRIGTT